MLIALREGRVTGLRVTVACARLLDEEPYDVYLLDVATLEPPAKGGDPFDEAPYLQSLEPVLDAAGPEASWVVEVARSHRSDRDGLGQARVSLLLGMGRAPSEIGPDRDLTAAVRSAFTRMARPPASLPAAQPSARPLVRGDALTAATGAVAHSFPGVDLGGLALTDEEHHADEGRWSLGLALPGVARFQVELGFVPGEPASAHLRRMPVGEVVDSVGT